MTPVARPAAAVRAAMLLLCLSFGSVALAQDDAPGAPQPERSVRDREFGVVARHYGLERRVEMLQWQRTPRGYVQAWSELPIDSSDYAEDRRNPGAFPLQSRRWTASKITVDGKPLDPAVVQQLGQWRLFRPSFSALPANLAATFQPEGDGLGSADNPLAPHIGDLRIHWRELVLPPLDDRIALRDGRWQLLAPPAPEAPQVVATARDDVSMTRDNHRAWWLGGTLIGVIAVFAAVRRRIRIRND
jgi:transmembrane protein TMEM43